MTIEKAERIARQLVQSWSPIDVQTALMESLGAPGENHLCSSIDNHFAKKEKRIFKIGRKLRDAVNDDEMFFEHERLVFTASIRSLEADIPLRRSRTYRRSKASHFGRATESVRRRRLA